MDTESDAESAQFAVHRRQLYVDPEVGAHVRELAPGPARRARMHTTLRDAASAGAKVRAICISSHGEPGRVIDPSSAGGTLLSHQDTVEELALVGSGRIVYICACRVAESILVDRLLDVRARCVVAFRGAPSWKTDIVLDLWRDFDGGIVKRIATSESFEAVFTAIHGLRSSLLRFIEERLDDDDPDEGPDLRLIQHVVETMVIRRSV